MGGGREPPLGAGGEGGEGGSSQGWLSGPNLRSGMKKEKKKKGTDGCRTKLRRKQTVVLPGHPFGCSPESCYLHAIFPSLGQKPATFLENLHERSIPLTARRKAPQVKHACQDSSKRKDVNIPDDTGDIWRRLALSDYWHQRNPPRPLKDNPLPPKGKLLRILGKSSHLGILDFCPQTCLRLRSNLGLESSEMAHQLGTPHVAAWAMETTPAEL